MSLTCQDDPFGDKEHKIVLMGSYGVGKSSVVKRIVHKSFDPYNEPTLGVAYSHIRRKIGNKTVIVTLWDTAGQERFYSLLPLYFRHANVCIICEENPDIARIEMWYQRCIREAPTARIVLCVTKFDSLNGVSDRDARQDYVPIEDWCIQNAITIFYTSAMHDKGISEMFDNICEKFVFYEYDLEKPPFEEEKKCQC